MIGDSDERRLLELLMQRQGYEVVLGHDFARSGELVGGSADALIADPSMVMGHLPRVLEHYGLSADHAVLLTVQAPASLDLPDGIRVLSKPIDMPRFLSLLHGMLGPPRTPTEGPLSRRRTPSFSGEWSDSPVVLLLYVHAGTIIAETARRNLEAVLAGYDSHAVELRTIDVTTAADINPEDRVVLTPLLVRRRPMPRQWLLGDLSSTEKVHHLLAASGLDIDL